MYFNLHKTVVLACLTLQGTTSRTGDAPVLIE